MKAVMRFEEWMEERNALNMVPVVMRDQDMGVNGTAAAFLGEVIAEHAQTGAAVEDEVSAVRGGQFEARRVAAVAPSIALQRRR